MTSSHAGDSDTVDVATRNADDQEEEWDMVDTATTDDDVTLCDEPMVPEPQPSKEDDSEEDQESDQGPRIKSKTKTESTIK
jgi:hypothetical protein